MTHLEKALSEIRERLDKATPGPWSTTNGTHVVQVSHITRDVWHICDTNVGIGNRPKDEMEKNKIFIANAPTDIEKLLKAAEVLIEACENSLFTLSKWEAQYVREMNPSPLEPIVHSTGKLYGAMAEVERIFEWQK